MHSYFVLFLIWFLSLERHWSSRILQKLFEKFLLKDEHLQVVINKHTRELDFQAVLQCESETVINRLKEVGNVSMFLLILKLSWNFIDILIRLFYIAPHVYQSKGKYLSYQ